MNDRGHYGDKRVGVAPGTSEQSSRGFSWGGLAFFGLVGGGLLLLVRPHYKEVQRARDRR